MTNLPLIALLPLIASVLWLLALVILIAHWLRPRFGLNPLLIILGVVAGVLEFPLFSYIHTSIGNLDLMIQITSFVFLPVLLLGLLVVYIVEGTTQARTVLIGILVATILSAVINTLSSLELSLSTSPFDVSTIWVGLRQLIASLFALMADLFILVIVYQGISNLRKRHPSGVAILLALMTALWCDALVFATIYFTGVPGAWQKLLLHLLGKTFSGLVLTPIASLYIYKFSQTFPDTAGTSQRPVLDILTTTQQFEARARYHYNLLQTLLKINRLVVRATNLQALLDQACQLLAANRAYLLVCIHLAGREALSARAGKRPELFTTCMVDENNLPFKDSPAYEVLNTQKALVVNHISATSENVGWAQKARQQGVGSLACFPLSHEQRTLGVMVIAAGKEQAFDAEEVERLGEIVEDLANAIVNFQLRQEQATLIAAAETMLDGLIITDLSGAILYANPVVAQVLRRDEKALRAENITSFIPVEKRERIVSTYLNKLYQQGSLKDEIELAIPGDRIYPLAFRVSLVYDLQHAPRQIVISIRDITSYRQYQLQLLALNQLITDMVQHRSKEELLPVVFAAAEELLEAQSSAVYLIGMNGKITDFVTHRLSDAYAQRIAQDYRGLPGETVFKTRKPVCVNDVMNDPVYEERIHFMAEHGIGSLLLLPILYENKLNGALVVYHDTAHNFTDNEVQLGMTLAHTIAIALQNLYLYLAEHSQRQFAEALAQAGANLNRLLNPEEVLDQILDQTIRITACRSANIMMVEGDEVRLVRRRGYVEAPVYPTESENFSLPLTAPTIRSMYESGGPLLISDTEQDERWSPVHRTEWIRSYAGVPLKVSGSIVGFLNVDSDQPDVFDSVTIQRLQALADHASIAIHNAELYSESNHQAQELSSLVQSAASVSSSLDFNQVLELLSKQMARIVDVEGCAISVYDQSNLSIKLLAYYTKPPFQDHASWHKPFDLHDYPTTRYVLQDKVIVQIHAEDPQADQIEVALMREAGVSTMLMLPLVVRDETIGLVEIESTESGREFSQREIALLQTLGTYAANAIENARLYSQLQEYASLLEKRVEERTAELRSSKEHIESILASIPDALFVLDDHYQPIRANQAGEELILQALAAQQNLFNADYLDRLHSGQLRPEDATIRIQDKSFQPLASPFPVQPGQPGLVVVFRDVTRFRELDEIKTHFVSDVSHELRTPLTNLTLYLDLLAALDDPQKGKGYIKTLQRETKRLGFLIEDLLTISRLEAGRVNISIKPTYINGLVADLVTDRTMLASSRQLTLIFTPDESIPPALTDASLFTQAVSNLLTNAINYTPPGKTVMLSNHLVQEEGEWWVTIDVADTGLGISTDELERIFERFYRGAASRETDAPGTGLGLAIAQEIADRVNGKLSVNSVLGQGSTFTLWLKAVL